MLKQKININEIDKYDKIINVLSYQIIDSEHNKEKNKIVCNVSDVNDLYIGMEVICFITVNTYNVNGDKTSNEIYFKLSIDNIDEQKNISFEVSKYQFLDMLEIKDNGNNSIIFNSDSNNYFSKYNSKCPLNIILDNKKIRIETDYYDYSKLEWKYNINNQEHLFLINKLFNNIRYIELEDEPENVVWDNTNSFNVLPSNVNYFSPKYIRITDKEYKYYKKEIFGFNNDASFLIDNVIFENFNEARLVYSKLTTSITIPLSQTFDSNLYQGDIINDAFIKKEIDESINDYTEMEKFSYCPVIPKIDNNKIIGFRNIDKLKFNLHFRQHRGDDWTADFKSNWNGVNNNYTFMDYSNSRINPFFSYGDISKQSDLLSYLNFNDSDIRYQKEALKRTFLRLSFYDSPDINQQNLLFYSTIFLDSGKLFSKLMRRINDGPYVDSGIVEDYFNYYSISSNREPCGPLLDLTDDEIEDYRLSSQFVVTDKLDSSSSSEGFYVYLWADNDAKSIPLDLYMKVEFNHAGNGRTVPMMMPFFDKRCDNRSGIKTFKNIVDDWSFGGYNVKNYLKYSHIHLKYQYDNANKQHVYYLDPDTYGDDVILKDESDVDEIVFNLYEAKLNFEEESSDEINKDVPINTEIYGLEITNFEWDNSVNNANDKKIKSINPCGGFFYTKISYKYYKSMVYKTFDNDDTVSRYLYYPNEQTYYKAFFDKTLNRYKRIDSIKIKPVIVDNLFTIHDYVRYKNPQTNEWGLYKYDYTLSTFIQIETIRQETIECTDGGNVEYSFYGNYNEEFFTINKDTGLVRVMPSMTANDLKATIMAKVVVYGTFSDNNKSFQKLTVDTTSSKKNIQIKVVKCEDSNDFDQELFFTFTTDARYAELEKMGTITLIPYIDTSYSAWNGVREMYTSSRFTVSNSTSQVGKVMSVTVKNINENLILQNAKNRKDEFFSSMLRNYDDNTYDISIMGKSLIFPNKIIKDSRVYNDEVTSKNNGVNGYETSSESEMNNLNIMLSDSGNGIIKEISNSQIIYFKHNPNDRLNPYEVLSLPPQQQWINLIPRGEIFEMIINKNNGEPREALWVFEDDEKTKYCKHITQLGTKSVNVKIIISIDGDEKKLHHAKIFRCDAQGNKKLPEIDFNNSSTFVESVNNNQYYNLRAESNNAMQLEFVGWSIGGSVDNLCSIYLEDDIEIIAYYTTNITYTVNGDNYIKGDLL